MNRDNTIDTVVLVGDEEYNAKMKKFSKVDLQDLMMKRFSMWDILDQEEYKRHVVDVVYNKIEDSDGNILKDQFNSELLSDEVIEDLYNQALFDNELLDYKNMTTHVFNNLPNKPQGDDVSPIYIIQGNMDTRSQAPKKSNNQKKIPNTSPGMHQKALGDPNLEQTIGCELDTKELDILDPTSTKAYLDDYVMGQEEAKKAVSVVMCKYGTKIKTGDSDIEKGNSISIGPSGSGKTYIYSVLADKLDMPFIETKISGKSYTGIVGENLQDAIFGQLMSKINLEKTKQVDGVYYPQAIVFLDEFDKLASDKGGGGRVGMFTKLQNEILGLAEGGNYTLEVGPQKEKVTVNTEEILFVAAGAFSGTPGENPSLVDIVQKRVNPNIETKTVGFEKPQKEVKKDKYLSNQELMSQITEEDLEKYGLLPELIGRFTDLAVLNKLKPNELVDILLNSKESVYKSYAKVLGARDYNLEITQDAAYAMVDRCSDKTGARAIKKITSDLFHDIIYSPQDYAHEQDGYKVITITSDLVNEKLPMSNYKTEKEIKEQKEYKVALQE